MKTFELTIVTPDQTLYTGNVESVQVPGTEGRFQVLFNHAPIISTLGEGAIKWVKEDTEESTIHTQGGVIEVLENKAIILVERVLA